MKREQCYTEIRDSLRYSQGALLVEFLGIRPWCKLRKSRIGEDLLMLHTMLSPPIFSIWIRLWVSRDHSLTEILLLFCQVRIMRVMYVRIRQCNRTLNFQILARIREKTETYRRPSVDGGNNMEFRDGCAGFWGSKGVFLIFSCC